MPLKDIDTIDMIAKTSEGPRLFITDTGEIPDPAERLAAYKEKIVFYLAWMATEEFRTEFPDWEQTKIVLNALTPPTPDMKIIDVVRYRPFHDDNWKPVRVELGGAKPVF